MMRWSWIDSSRKREALAIVFRTRHCVSAVHGSAWTKNRENDPMQSGTRLAAPLLRCVRAGGERDSKASLIPL